MTASGVPAPAEVVLGEALGEPLGEPLGVALGVALGEVVGEPSADLLGEALGVALAMLANTFNFPLYLLSGGQLGAWELFAPAMLEEMRRRSFTFRISDTRVEKSMLGDEAGLYGAAYLPWLETR